MAREYPLPALETSPKRDVPVLRQVSDGRSLMRKFWEVTASFWTCTFELLFDAFEAIADFLDD